MALLLGVSLEINVSQSSIIAAALIIGFLVFITARGELPGYLQVLGI